MTSCVEQVLKNGRSERPDAGAHGAFIQIASIAIFSLVLPDQDVDHLPRRHVFLDGIKRAGLSWLGKPINLCEEFEQSTVAGS